MATTDGSTRCRRVTRRTINSERSNNRNNTVTPNCNTVKSKTKHEVAQNKPTRVPEVSVGAEEGSKNEDRN